MEFMLSGQGGQLRLPVPPADFTVQSGNINQTVNVVRQGEINLWGPEKLDGITLQSFFPKEYAPYCCYSGFPAPWDCVKTIDEWRNSGKPVRVIITDSNLGVDINMQVLIESFDKTMRDHTGDVYYSLTLKKYKIVGQTDAAGNTQNRELPADKWDGQTYGSSTDFFTGSIPGQSGIGTNNSYYLDESGATNGGITYTGKAGEDLWDVAKDLFGVGALWKNIYSDNKSKLDSAVSSIAGIKLDIKWPF